MLATLLRCEPGDKAQFAGWPITVDQDANDGREVAGWLPSLQFAKGVRPVVQVIEDATGEVLYTTRAKGETFSRACTARANTR